MCSADVHKTQNSASITYLTVNILTCFTTYEFQYLPSLSKDVSEGVKLHCIIHYL
jgi:hypothetical protein